MSFPIYIQADLSDFDSPLDIRRSATPAFWAGCTVAFKIGVFEFGSIRDVSDLASLTLTIKKMGSNGARPDPAATALLSKTVTSFDTDTTETEWYAYTNAHASVSFSGAETSIEAGSHWMVITAETTAGQALTLCAGTIEVEEDGFGTASETSTDDNMAYTKTASDARYARLVEGGMALYVDATSGNDDTGTRGRCDLPFATIAAAISASSEGDSIYVAPGTYATATVSKALHLHFMTGSTLSSPLAIAVSGVYVAGVLCVESSVSYCMTAESAYTVSIDGVLSVNKPVGSNITLSGGVLVNRSASSIDHPGLSDVDTEDCKTRLSALETSEDEQNTAIETETARAESAENALSSAVSSEAATRASADTTLQTNIDSEASTRAAAVSSEATSRALSDRYKLNWNGRAYTGGYSSMPADYSRAACLTFGGMFAFDGVLDSMTAAGTYTIFCEVGQLCVDHVQSSASAATGCVQVSVATSAGTFVVQTSSACITYGEPVAIGVAIANPSGGSIGPSACTVYVNGTSQTLTTVTSYTGTITATTSGILYLMTYDTSTQIAQGLVNKVWWLNYAPTSAQLTQYFANRRLPTNKVGTMSSGSTDNVLSPAALLYFKALGKTVSKIACGYKFTLYLCSDGTVYGCGDNTYGQLGDGTTISRSTPVAMSGISTATAVSAGQYHSLILLSTGVVMACGYNYYGQLGNGTTTTPQTTPVAMSGISTATAISAGYKHSLILLSSGVVMGCGYNTDGELGDGTTTTQTTPVAMSGISTATAISAGYKHSLILLSTGAVMGCGNNYYGSLGQGTSYDNTAHSTPLAMSGISTATAISAGYVHSLVLLSSGVVMGCGYNAYGQIGNGSTDTIISTPVAMSGISTAEEISAGYYHSLVRLSTGTVMGCGSNAYGQLGNGTTTTPQTTPLAMSGISTATAISVGQYHSLFLLSSGVVMGCGSNAYGQIAGHYEAGNLLAGLDLYKQPMQSFTADMKSFLDSASGVELWPYYRPERMILMNQSTMTAAGYLGDSARLVHPADYVAAEVRATNTGSASVTVYVRATSSSGSIIASGTVAATGLPVVLTNSVPAANTPRSSGGIVHVTGGASTSPIDVSLELRKVKAR